MGGTLLPHREGGKMQVGPTAHPQLASPHERRLSPCL